MLAALVCEKKKLILDNIGEIILLAAFASLTDCGNVANFILGEGFLTVLKAMGYNKLTFGSATGLKMMGLMAKTFKTTTGSVIWMVGGDE